ncbi:choline-glycine betaine transporter [Bacillus sp. OxB-1]|nr:hypothetical protein [Bacillus sp. OxB-1]BAQ11846.1 choline-glycine betaine transporter [Bacillus sp. OxB-1]
MDSSAISVAVILNWKPITVRPADVRQFKRMKREVKKKKERKAKREK